MQGRRGKGAFILTCRLGGWKKTVLPAKEPEGQGPWNLLIVCRLGTLGIEARVEMFRLREKDRFALLFPSLNLTELFPSLTMTKLCSSFNVTELYIRQSCRLTIKTFGNQECR
jgi:hypothetical protein